MINNFIFSRPSKNWIRAFSLCSILTLGTSCSDNEEIATDSKEVISASAKLNTVYQAEDYDDQEGIQKSNNNTAVGYIQDEDWIKFEDFDHSGATSITVRASSGKSGGTIQFRKGSATGGNLLAEVEVPGTGGWTNFQEFTADITGSSNNSDLYIVFIGGSGYLLDIDNFEFTSGSTDPGGDSISAYSRIQAESYDDDQGIIKSNGGSAIGYITTGDWVKYENVDFDGGAASVKIRVSKGSTGTGKVTFRKGSSTGTTLGSVSFGNTGGWTSFDELTTSISNSSGTHDLYLTFTGGLDVDWFEFSEEEEEEVNNNNGGGDSPGDVLGLSEDDWKLNGFDDTPGNNASYLDDVLAERDEDYSSYENEDYFYTDGEWTYFKCYRGLDSSKNSLNPRVELRELDGGDDNYTWDGNNGTHTMEYKVRVDRLPKSTSGSDGVVCFGQIHGPGDTTDDAVRVQFRGAPNQTSGEVQLKISGYVTEEQGGSKTTDGFELGREYTVKIVYAGKKIFVYMDGEEMLGDGEGKLMDIASKGWDWKGNYFKVGNYLQSVKDASFDGSYGVVRIKDLSVTHPNSSESK